ncbi:MAG: ABC transporter ATP-binding protein [Acidimicrobiia bacterium]|nr:ABC transporter ATP-binding protein [Acidimicrobiia bacterium]
MEAPVWAVDAQPLLVAAGIRKSYRRGGLVRRRSFQVLIDAGVELHRGEIVGLVGENGSGKSTLMKILIGSLDRDGGTLTRHGSIGYCPQKPILYERLTPDEHFELFGHAHNLEPAVMESARDEILEILDFTLHRGVRVEELSGGTRAKLNLGLALLADPDILLLDEPYAGFDWDTYLRFWDLTAERRKAGSAVLIVSHFVADEERFDRIVHLEDGRTVAR